MTHRIEHHHLADLVARLDPQNEKLHTLEDIKASIRRHGFTEPPLVDERTGLIGAGHGRIEALLEMQQAGEDPPRRISPADDGDWMVPVLREGHESPDDLGATDYRITANRLTEVGGWDLKRLTTNLKTLADAGRLTGTGYTEVDLSALVKSYKDSTAGDDGAPDQSARLITRRSVLVDVADDAGQRQLIDRLTKEGYSCRALNS